MKYFSPNILDGSVTEAKLADDAVTRSKLNLLNTSQAGNIGIQSRVRVVFTSSPFFPDIEGDQSAVVTLNMTMVADFVASPSAAANFPAFELLNEDTGSTRDYDVAWEYIGV